MNIQSFNDKILHSETIRASKAEKTTTVNLLKHLQEVSRRKLFVDFGHSTLSKYMDAELGYSESEAWTRIQAMRLLKTVPAAAEKIEAGQLSLSNASLLQGYIQDNGIQKEPEKVAEALKKAEDLSNRKLKEEFKPQEPKDKKLIIGIKLQEKIKKLQASWGEMHEAEILEALIDEKLREIELKRDTKQTTKPISSKPTRYLPVSVRREIFGRSKNQCEHKTKDGTRCKERRNLQWDHINPFSLGGDRTADNIRILCTSHNLRRSIKTFGTRGELLG